MCTLPLLAGENVGHAFVVPTVAALHRPGRARRHRARRPAPACARSSRVPGRVEGDVVETADVFTTAAGRLVRADGFPPHAERFERAGLRPRRAALARRVDG